MNTPDPENRIESSDSERETRLQTRPADKCGCPCRNCQTGECRELHGPSKEKLNSGPGAGSSPVRTGPSGAGQPDWGGSKTLNYRGRRITPTWREPHLVEIGYQGHSGHIGVSRQGPGKLPYFYTMAGPEQGDGRLVEIPASNLMEAAENCCAGLVNLRHGKPAAGEFDQEKAAEVLRDWYDAI